MNNFEIASLLSSEKGNPMWENSFQNYAFPHSNDK